MNIHSEHYADKPALAGAVLSTGGQSMPDLWRILHSNANLCARFARTGQQRKFASVSQLIGDAEMTIRQELQSIPAPSWERLCEAAGWTQIGAAALSWCEGACAEQVWRAWDEARITMPTEESFFLAARSMNEMFLLEDQTLSSFVPLLLTERSKVYVSLAVRSDQVRMDCSTESLRSLPEDFRRFIAHPNIELAYPDTKR